MAQNYKVKVHCTNCGLKKEIEIPVGVERKKQPCPNCGIAGMLDLYVFTKR